MSRVWEYFVNAFSQIRVWDVLDVFIIAYILYKILALAKETRAYQLLRGLGFIILVSWLSELLGLTALNWMLKYVLGAGAIVMAIVFQPELRRMLDQLGRGKMFAADFAAFQLSSKDAEQAVEEILAAMQHMSKRKLGALIVVEGNTALEEILESGVRLDAHVSSALLQNIFETGTPLHDGAVVIQHNKILAAGCFLPLTANPNVPTELGTRHRAALGLSENADALVLVISEETGVISMARDGVLTRYLDYIMLKQVLVGMLHQDRTKKVRLKYIQRLVKRSRKGGEKDVEDNI